MARSTTSPPNSIPTRSSLLAGLRESGNEDAWQQFSQTYGGLIRRLALKAQLREDEADEVLQEVLIGVNRNIGDFVYDPAVCSFKHWLSQLVCWRITDQFKKRTTAQRSGPRPDTGARERTSRERDEPSPPELEALWEAEWKAYLLDQAADSVKKLVAPKQFQIFFLHVLRDKPVPEVVQQLAVSRAQVYLAKLRVGRLFRQEVRRLEKNLA